MNEENQEVNKVEFEVEAEASSKTENASRVTQQASDYAAVAAGAILKLLTPERIVGIITLILIPCLMASWIHVSALDKFGLNMSLSAPEALSTSSKLIEDVEKTGDVIGDVKSSLSKAANMLEKSGEILNIASTILSDDSADYREVLSSALNALGETETAQTITSPTLRQEAQENINAATSTVDEVQSAVKEAQSTANQLEADAVSALNAAKAICNVLSVAWYAFLLLMFVAGILLLVGVRGRYALGIIALALTFIASVGTVVGVSFANSIVVDTLSDSLGMWILMLFPEIVSTTAWPWVTVFLSLASLIALCVLLARRHNQTKKLKAATE